MYIYTYIVYQYTYIVYINKLYNLKLYDYINKFFFICYQHLLIVMSEHDIVNVGLKVRCPHWE